MKRWLNRFSRLTAPMMAGFPRYCLGIVLVCTCLLLLSPAAIANVDDDRYEGNIFALYAGNGAIIPPRTTLEQALMRQRPALLHFYIDDSRDCKQFSIVVSQLQRFYGRAADFIVLDVDALPVKENYEPTEAAYYYKGFVPQTLIIDEDGKVVFDGVGQVKFEAMDDVLREVFDLLPRSESVELKRRSPNEISSELAE